MVEPFAGGAAVFFHSLPPNAWLNDINPDLINVYIQLRSHWEIVLALLLQYQDEHSSSFYYSMRAHRPVCAIEQAARFIYLNRTCFNGIYRVNLRGDFNVPMGSKTTVVLDSDNFEAVSRSLTKVKLTTLDFEKVIDACGVGDFLFVDPPYTVKHNLNGFVKYNETLFAWSDQIRLRNALIKARDRGSDVVICNAHHHSILDLYRAATATHILDRHSVIAASAAKRRGTTEIMVRL